MNQTYIFLCMSSIAFLSGHFICYAAKPYVVHQDTNTRAHQVDKNTLDYLNKISQLLTTLGVFATIIGYQNLIRDGGFSLLVSQGHRAVEKSFGFSSLNNAFWFLFLITPFLYAILYKHNYLGKGSYAWLLIIGFIPMITHGVKGNIIAYGLVAGYSAYLYGVFKPSFSKVMFGVSLGMFFFFLVMISREFSTSLDKVKTGKISDLATGLYEKVEGYTSANYKNLEAYTLNKDHLAWGLGILSIPACYAALEGSWCIKKVNANLDYAKPIHLYRNKAYIIETWLGKLYLDFGLASFIIFPFLIGVLSEMITFRYFRYGTIFDTFLYVYFLICLTLTFFDNRFVRPQYYYVVGVMFLICKIGYWRNHLQIKPA